MTIDLTKQVESIAEQVALGNLTEEQGKQLAAELVAETRKNHEFTPPASSDAATNDPYQAALDADAEEARNDFLLARHLRGQGIPPQDVEAAVAILKEKAARPTTSKTSSKMINDGTRHNEQLANEWAASNARREAQAAKDAEGARQAREAAIRLGG